MKQETEDGMWWLFMPAILELDVTPSMEKEALGNYKKWKQGKKLDSA